MKAVAAIDSFKGSLSSLEAGEAAKKGILRAYPDAEVVVRPLADGGEGTVEALIAGMNGEKVPIRVTGPLGEKVDCVYGIIPSSRTAVMEIAQAAGLPIVPPEKRNPLNTTTYGVGEMIRDALKRGARNFIVGIGGCATNDCGIGMLEALGFEITDASGKPVSMFGRGLEHAAAISAEHAVPELKESRFRIACDVDNPLCGPLGCSAIFGPQKGATPELIEIMDRWIMRFAEITRKVYPDADREFPGTGAAGGLGFAFRTFFHSTLEPGIDIVLDVTHFEDYIRDADIAVTGEGRMDRQTAMGKAPSGVAKAAAKYGIPVIGFSGSVTKDATVCNEHGIHAFFPVLRSVVTLEDAMKKENAAANLADTSEQVFRLIRAVSGNDRLR